MVIMCWYHGNNSSNRSIVDLQILLIIVQMFGIISALIMVLYSISPIYNHSAFMMGTVNGMIWDMKLGYYMGWYSKIDLVGDRPTPFFSIGIFVISIYEQS